MYVCCIIDTGVEGQADTDLLKSSQQGRLILNYQELQVGPDATTLGWLHTLDRTSPCATSTYQVDVYSRFEILTESQRDLVALHTIQSAQKMITVSSHLLMDGANSPNYFQISALENCGTSRYYHNLFFNG